MNTSPALGGQRTRRFGGAALDRLRALSTLDKLTAAALFAMSPLLVFGMWTIGGSIDAIALACGAAALLAAALVVATGRRWAPLLAAVPGALTFAVAGRFIIQSLFEPYETISFGFWLFIMAIMGVATVASVTGTAQNYLQPARRTMPAWVTSLLVAIAAGAMAGIMVAALPQRPAGVQVQEDVFAKLPAVVSKDFKWDQSVIRIKAGESAAIRLENEDEGPHSLDIDELGVHAPMPSGKTSVALFTATEPGTYTFYCAVGTHRKAGMEGTLIVEP